MRSKQVRLESYKCKKPEMKCVEYFERTQIFPVCYSVLVISNSRKKYRFAYLFLTLMIIQTLIKRRLSAQILAMF